MKVKVTEKYYPYIDSGGMITAHAYHSESSCFGICLVDKDSPTDVEVTVDFNIPENPTESVIVAFDRQIEKERADAEVRIENLQLEKQKFLALEVSE